MAERKITNNTILLFLGEDADALDTIVCLTKVGNSFTIDELDATSLCGPDKTPGTFSGQVTFDGQHLLDPATGKASGYSLFTWMVNKITLFYKISPAVPVDGDVVETGTGFITSLSNDYAYNTQSVFSSALSIKGTPEQTIYAEPGETFRILDETGDCTLAETGDFILTEAA